MNYFGLIYKHSRLAQIIADAQARGDHKSIRIHQGIVYISVVFLIMMVLQGPLVALALYGPIASTLALAVSILVFGAFIHCFFYWPALEKEQARSK